MEERVTICVCGPLASGKTALINRYHEARIFEYGQPTIGADLFVHYHSLPNEASPVRLDLWDISGKELNRRSAYSAFKYADAVIFVYDLSRRESFEEVTEWIAMVTGQGSPLASLGSNLERTVVASKTDLDDRAVERDEGRSLARALSARYIEVSAKTSNVDRVFADLTAAVLFKRRRVSRTSLPGLVGGAGSEARDTMARAGGGQEDSEQSSLLLHSSSGSDWCCGLWNCFF